MISQLIQWDHSLFLFLNGMHNEFWDVVMYWTSEKLTWIPLYLLWLIYIIRKQKYYSVIYLLFVALLITCSDQASVHLFKDVFMRPRPCHEPLLQGMVHTVNGECGGDYGFVSSHAANFFALAMFFTLTTGRDFKKYAWISFVLAGFISYSRIYLGVHFPGDVLCGSILGLLIGFLISILYHFITSKYFPHTLGDHSEKKKCNVE
jgi:undecaprenyl-diphosphatase